MSTDYLYRIDGLGFSAELPTAEAAVASFNRGEAAGAALILSARRDAASPWMPQFKCGDIRPVEDHLKRLRDQQAAKEAAL